MQDIERSDSAKFLLKISDLDNVEIAYFNHTILVDGSGKKRSGKITFLTYLFDFLDAFDFGSSHNLQDNAKTLINSSVLGLVFEQLNAYKDGSFYTPSFITSYMCEKSLQKIVLDKFNETFSLKATTLRELRDDLREAKISKDSQKQTLLNIHILDPAVGSGHFLVSILNEMLNIYNEFRLFENDFCLEVKCDEIVIKTQRGEIIEYKRPKNADDKIHAIFKEIFHTKKTLSKIVFLAWILTKTLLIFVVFGCGLSYLNQAII